MRIRPSLLLVGLALATTAACSGADGSSSSYDVKAGDDSCRVSRTDLPAGKATFEVTNTGSQVTEVYVYGKEGEEFTKIIGEKENIGPGTSQSFTVNLSAGEYEVACKPGMTGDGIRTKLEVSGDSDGGGQSEAAYDEELEFEVAADGSVKPPQDLAAAAGDRIEFKLENQADEEHYLVVEDASGTQIGKAEAAAGSDGEFIAELADAGTYTIRVYPDGNETAATKFSLPVQ